jgi:hypothetical protein
VVEWFSTFEILKSREDLGCPLVGHVVEIEASGVWEIISLVDRRLGKSIVKTPT